MCLPECTPDVGFSAKKAQVPGRVKKFGGGGATAIIPVSIAREGSQLLIYDGTKNSGMRPTCHVPESPVSFCSTTGISVQIKPRNGRVLLGHLDHPHQPLPTNALHLTTGTNIHQGDFLLLVGVGVGVNVVVVPT